MARMWDVSAYMKSVKGRFTPWYNRRHGHKGTLWEECFKSVLVEGSGTVLAAMAAYIDAGESGILRTERCWGRASS